MKNITVEELKSRLDAGEQLHIIDVREPSEYAEYNIGGKLIPLGQIMNMQLEELRMNKKMGEDDPALLEEVKQKQSDLESKQDALSVELQQIWEDWDQAQEATSEAAIGCANAKMLDLLNRRNYIRNLVRDVNELLEA